MPITGPFYWNEVTFPVNTSGDPEPQPVLILEATFQDCCCICETCDGAQPDAVITGAAGTSGGVDCADALNGAHSWIQFDDRTDSCGHTWQLPDTRLLQLFRCKADGTYCIRVTGFYGANPADCDGDCSSGWGPGGGTVVNEDIVCTDGNWTGTVTVVSDISDCTGTVTVTFG